MGPGAIMKRGKPRELSVQRMKFYPNKLFVTQEAGEQEDRNVTWQRRAQYMHPNMVKLE